MISQAVNQNATARFRCGVIDPSKSRVYPVAITDLWTQYPDMRPVVIEGVLRRGEVCNVIAPTKLGKSFFVGGLAWCVATGRPWLGHETAKGNVLIIDNELHPETLSSRLMRIAQAMGIDPQSDSTAMDVLSLRGHGCKISELEYHLGEDAKKYSLIVLDALYRTLPEGTSENDNAKMMDVYNWLDHHAKTTEAAIVVVHHSSKGDQSDKSITDVGSGAGSISRAADTHIILRPHEEPGYAVLEAVTRSFPGPSPISIRWEYPLWSDTTKAPAIKLKMTPGKANQKANDAEADQAIIDTLSKQTNRSERQIRRDVGMGETRVERAVARLTKAKKIEKKFVKRGGRKVAIYRLVPTSDGPEVGPQHGPDQNDSGPCGPVRPM